MRYNEKHSLYESIMNDVAKVVKRKLNEDSSFNNTSSYNYAKNIADDVANAINEKWDNVLQNIKEGVYIADDDYEGYDYNEAFNSYAKEIEQIRRVSENPNDARIFFDTLIRKLQELMKQEKSYYLD